MQKMTLVPFDPVLSSQPAYNPYFRQTLDTNEPAVSAIQHLQHDMSRILDDPNLSNYAKASFLTQMEGRVQTNLKRYREATAPQTVSTPATTTTTSSGAASTQTTTTTTTTPATTTVTPSNSDILQGVHKLSRRKAGHILDVLKANPEFKLNEKKEIVVGEKPIEGSNIVDLLNFTATSKNVKNLEGVDVINKYLQDSKIPKAYLSRQATVYPSQKKTSSSEPRRTRSLAPPILTREQTGSGWDSFPRFYVKDHDLYRHAIKKSRPHPVSFVD